VISEERFSVQELHIRASVHMKLWLAKFMWYLMLMDISAFQVLLHSGKSAYYVMFILINWAISLLPPSRTLCFHRLWFVWLLYCYQYYAKTTQTDL